MNVLNELWEKLSGHQNIDMKQLLYPGKLPTFQELAISNHQDKRALIYLLRSINVENMRPFDTDALYNWKDFGTAVKAYQELKRAGLIIEIDKLEKIALEYTREELKKILREQELPTSGTKDQLISRLLKAKYKFSTKSKKRFRISNLGKSLLMKQRSDRCNAVTSAINALKNLDYRKAVEAYRNYDNAWGFSHVSGNTYTIFAYYDIPFKRFEFFEKYPMKEVKNSTEYKKTLRAVLLAGLMRGCHDDYELCLDFERIISEPLICPYLLKLFDDYSKEVLDNMQRQIEDNKSNALRYYIGHLKYLNRQENPWF